MATGATGNDRLMAIVTKLTPRNRIAAEPSQPLDGGITMFRINDSLSVGGQPTEEDLPLLRREGYRSVVNFRADGETHDQWQPAEEGAKVEKLGLKYFHLPTLAHTLTTDVLDRFRAAYPNLPLPIYAHCATGKRAAAIVFGPTCVSAIHDRQRSRRGGRSLRPARPA